MRYVSETTLRAMFTNEGYPTKLADLIIAEITEEVLEPQWQTLEEFDVEGWCWITVDGAVDMAYYAGGLFYYDDACDKTVHDTWSASTITHVQHIPKPEALK